MSKAEIQQLAKELSDEYKGEVSEEFGLNKYRYDWNTNPKDIRIPPFEENGRPYKKAEAGAFHMFADEKIYVTFPAKIVCLKNADDDKEVLTYEHRKKNLMFELDTNDIPESERETLTPKELEIKQKKLDAIRKTYNVLKEIDAKMRDKFIKGPLPKGLKKYTPPQNRENSDYRGILFEKTDKQTGNKVPGCYLGFIPLNYIPSEKEFNRFKTEFDERVKVDPKLENLKVPEKPNTLVTRIIISPELKKKLGLSKSNVEYDDLDLYIKRGTMSKITICIQGHSLSKLSLKTKMAVSFISVLSLSDNVSSEYRRDELDDLFQEEENVSTKKLKVEDDHFDDEIEQF